MPVQEVAIFSQKCFGPGFIVISQSLEQLSSPIPRQDLRVQAKDTD